MAKIAEFSVSLCENVGVLEQVEERAE